MNGGWSELNRLGAQPTRLVPMPPEEEWRLDGDGDTSPIPTPEPHPDDVPDGDIAITEAQPEPVDDDGTEDTEEPDHA